MNLLKGIYMTSNIISGKPSLLKKMNRNSIIKLLIREKQMSRSELAKATRLALPSVMRLVDGLIADELLVDMGKGKSTGGRKPNLLTLNKDAMYFIGVEIALDTTVVLTNMLGEIVDVRRSGQMAFESPEAMLEQIVVYIDDLLKGKDVVDKVAGVGVGTPGTNFKYVRTVHHSILKGWESIDVQEWFSQKLPFKVVVDNIARTRTLSEMWFGKAKQLDDFVYVLVDQGVGCGIVSKGSIVRGADEVSGEFGHTVIELDGKPCYCGNEGCIEMYVSAGGIINSVLEGEGVIVASFEETKNYPIIQEKAGRYLGAGVANLINVLNPSAVILGGEVVHDNPVLIDAAIKTMESHIFSRNAMNTSLLISDAYRDDVALGSIALVFNHIFESKDF